jgi:hypothetical protein
MGAGGIGIATARGTFATDSLRGRYTGNLTIGESFSDGTTVTRIEARQLLALDFDAQGAVAGASSVTVAVPGQPTFTCPYTVAGTYEIGDQGMGSASLALTSQAETCGGGSAVTVQLSLLVGGHNRSRLDVVVERAVTPDGEVPLVGSGVLVK